MAQPPSLLALLPELLPALPLLLLHLERGRRGSWG